MASTGPALARACDHADQDTSHYLHTPLYRACAVSVKARAIANDVRPEYRPNGRDRSCFSAVIQVAVDTAGFPEGRTARVVRASDPGFAAAVLAIVPAMRFEPARLGEHRVRQLFELREVMVIRQGRAYFGGGPRPAVAGVAGSVEAAAQIDVQHTTRRVVWLPAPELGEHTADVLKMLRRSGRGGRHDVVEHVERLDEVGRRDGIASGDDDEILAGNDEDPLPATSTGREHVAATRGAADRWEDPPASSSRSTVVDHFQHFGDIRSRIWAIQVSDTMGASFHRPLRSIR